MIYCTLGSSRRSLERDRGGAGSSSVTVSTTEGTATAGSAVAPPGSAAGSAGLGVAAGSGALERDRGSSAGGSGGVGGPSNSDRDTIFRWRDRQYYSGPKRWLESALRDPAWQDKDDDVTGTGGKKRESSVCQSPL